MHVSNVSGKPRLMCLVIRCRANRVEGGVTIYLSRRVHVPCL